MNQLNFDAFHLLVTAFGLSWTLLTLFLLLHPKGRALLSRPAAPFLFAACLFMALYLVTGEIGRIEALTPGLRILDARLHYIPNEAFAYANALGPSGRAEYALFQLSFDTLAPPAFACFVGSVAHRLLKGRVLDICRNIILIYLGCVLPANALMPIYMLNHPTPSQPWIALLLDIVPRLDFFKYLSHGVAWGTILVGSIWLRLGAGKGSGQNDVLSLRNTSDSDDSP